MHIYIVRGFCSNGAAVGAKRDLQNASFSFLGPKTSDVMSRSWISLPRVSQDTALSLVHPRNQPFGLWPGYQALIPMN